MYRNSGCRLALMSALGLSLIGLLVGSPLWGDGGDPKKGEYWYHEAGCDNCHGKKGRGDGPSGATLNPKPANYCTSTKHPTDALKIQMITEGGGSMGHSPDMPAWGGVLDQQAIVDIVAYIHTLCEK
jgi:mono/diheme cytochrome c family protein